MLNKPLYTKKKVWLNTATSSDFLASWLYLCSLVPELEALSKAIGRGISLAITIKSELYLF